jgi:hypothetical protein
LSGNFSVNCYHQEKKKLVGDFSLSCTVQLHLYSVISSRLAVNWQVGQLITWQLHLLKKRKFQRLVLEAQEVNPLVPQVRPKLGPKKQDIE